jgi:hypothetical protein
MAGLIFLASCTLFVIPGPYDSLSENRDISDMAIKTHLVTSSALRFNLSSVVVAVGF